MAAELKARLTLNNAAFLSGMRRSLQSGRQFAASLASTGFKAATAALAATAAAAAAVGAALSFALKKAYDLGGALSDVAAQTGMSAGRVMVFRKAFIDAGMSAEDVGGVFARMSRTIAEAASGSEAAASTIQGLGLSVEELMMMSQEERLLAIGDAIMRLKDPALRSAAAMNIFGRSGSKLLTFFPAARQGLDMAARQLGSQVEIMDRNAGAFDEISDRLAGVSDKMQGLFVGAADEVSGPLLTSLKAIETLDLAPVGQKLGAILKEAGAGLLGAIANPEEGIAVLKTAMGGVAAEFANRLQQAMDTAAAWFSAGMQSTIQGIGQMLLGSLLEAFSQSVAVFSANLQAAVAAASNPERAKLMVQQAAADKRAGMFDWLADKAGRDSAIGGALARDADAEREKSQGYLKQLSNFSFDDMDTQAIEKQIMADGGPRMRIGDQDMNAAQLKESGAKLLRQGFGAMQPAEYKDNFGAGEAFANSAEGFRDLNSAGRAAFLSATAPRMEPFSFTERRGFTLASAGAGGEGFAYGEKTVSGVRSIDSTVAQDLADRIESGLGRIESILSETLK